MGQSPSREHGEPARRDRWQVSPQTSEPSGIDHHRRETAGSTVSPSGLDVIRHRRRYTWVGAEGSPHSRGRGFSSQGEGPNPLDVNDSQSFDLGQRTPRDARDVDASLQHEETPTISTPAVDLESERDATVATSYLSRLGARLTPRNFSSEHSEERPGRHRAVRYRLQDRFNSLRGPRHGPRARDLSNSSLTSPTRAPSSERSDAATVSGPVPLSSQDSWSRRSISASTLALESETSTAPSSISTNVPGPSRNSRLSRVRDSLFLPIPNMIQNFANRTSRLGDSPGSSSRRQSRGILTENSEPFLPRHSPPAIGVDIDDTPLTPSLFTSASRPRRNRSISDPDVRSPSIERQARRLQNSLRRGPSRPQRGEDQAAMLSRLLSVAAAATAASLVGNTDRAFSEAHDVAGDGVDGSFDGFLQALQNGSLAAALRNGGNEMGGGSENSSGDGSFTPVNFFRMFRFGATNSDGGRSSGSTTPTDEGYEGSRSGSQQSTVEREGSETPSPRMVPVIIVGIRSVTPLEGITQGEGGTTTPPLFDALSNLPLTMPNGLPRGGPQGTLMRRTDRRSRFARSRRASMSAVNYDSQRHQRSTSGALQTLPDSRPLMSSALPTVLSDSPPGPHPPPSTPADYALSAFSSGTNTPSRRPSSAAGGPLLANPLPSWQENTQQSPNSTNASLNRGSSSSTPPVAAQRRRLSDGEFARHRDLGSGSSRRNGIVGDSDVSAGARRAANGTPTEGTRSWIIYVLGGSYPEDHPILTTPSLFTDSPTYEDMLLLASILGPAKPPVATHEDVASAPGVYRVGGTREALVADRAGFDQIQIAPGERCLVCLCDYELSEEVRQLSKCGHLYHRDCIDEWLTTGRNSCPLCREQGVDENASRQKHTDEQAPEQATGQATRPASASA